MLRNAKKALAALLILFICLLSVHFTNVRAQTRFSGGVTEGEAILIGSAEELLALAASVNSGEDHMGELFLLTADIDLGGGEWIPIGDGGTNGNGGQNVFRGSFSGGGHTISGIRTAETLSLAGFFGMTEGGEVRELNITGVEIRSAGKAGGVIASANGTLIENVGFSGTVCGGNCAGGIAGELAHGGISGCTVNASVSGVMSVGGITGAAENAAIIDCDVHAAVSGEQYAGGAAGIADSTAFTGITAGGSVADAKRAGGIVGYCFDCGLDNCTSSVDMIGTDYAGGIAGHGQTSTLANCENIGSVEAEWYTGGMCGYCIGCSFDSCANRGEVSGTDYVGGIIGWSDDGADFGDSELDNILSGCMNTGRVNGNWGVGGLIGDSHDAVVSDCFNTGAIVSADYAGGLTGYTKESSFIRCYSIGEIICGGNAGALAGRNSMDSSAFENCLYLDTCCACGDPLGAPISEQELTAATSYPDFDSEIVWELSCTGYPFARLRSVLPPEPLAGDTDGDGEVTVTDALIALRCAIGISELSPLERFRADMTVNGAIEATDALLILREAMGIG